MNPKIFMPMVFLIGICTLISCQVTPPTLPSGSQPGDGIIAALLPSLDMETITRCQEHEDCIIVLPECCGNYTAIHQAYLDDWNSHQKALKRTCPLIVCEPLLPVESFAARCIDEVCKIRDASCEEEIEDPGYYQDLLQQHPTLSQLEIDLNLLEIQIPDPCVMDGKVRANLRFEIPTELSTFDVVYMADLRVWYRLGDNTFEPAYDPTYNLTAGPSGIDPELVLDYFRKRILDLEQDPRIAEMHEKLGWDSAMGRVYLSNSPVRVQFHKGSVEYMYPYNNPDGGVFEYVVPSHVDWQSFPEIQMAHRIIQEELLTDNWSFCSISKGGWAYSNTVGRNWHDNPDFWWVEVDLDCSGTWKTAAIKINLDGSYEQLEVR